MLAVTLVITLIVIAVFFIVVQIDRAISIVYAEHRKPQKAKQTLHGIAHHVTWRKA